MDAAVAAETHQVQPVTGAGVMHGGEQHGVRVELAVRDHVVDASDVHVDHAAGADVEMAHFAVAHLAIGQADVRARGVHQRVGEIAQQHVVSRLARGGDRVAFEGGRETPAVEDGEDEWLVS